MMDRRRTGRILLSVTGGEEFDHIPAHLDVVVGAARPSGSLDRGRVDRAVVTAAGAFRVSRVFHARDSFGRVGARSLGYDPVEHELGLSRTYRIELADPDSTESTVRRLRDLDQVESAAPELLATAPAATVMNLPTRMTREMIEWPHRMVGSQEALETEPGDERVTVGVVDTGVSLGHAELQRKLLSGYDAVELGLGRISTTVTLVGDSHGRDFSPSDDVGHGSHVAGIIGAQGWQLPRGVGGRSLLLPIRVLAGAQTIGDSTITGVGALGDIDAGLKVCVDLGAKVINMSFGTPDTSLDEEAPRPHARVVDYARRRGCVLIAASGNSGVEERYYPAASPGVLAVGSVGPEGNRSTFSTYGDHVAISAPGEKVMSVGRRGYRSSTGTSHAAPFVAGAAALLLARVRRYGLEMEPEEVGSLLVATSRPGGSPTYEMGAGVLDVPAAIAELDRRIEEKRGNEMNRGDADV